ncbi:hypothetical protein GGI12_006374, partial [Dipsacomyces acuminosporus]
ATATLDRLTGRPLSEEIFGLTPQQVKNVDSAITRAEQAGVSALANAYQGAAKTIVKMITQIDKESSPAFKDATDALNKALTPDVRDKLKKAVSSIVDSTLNVVLH